MKERLQVKSPYDLSLIEEIEMHNSNDVQSALSLAKSTFDRRSNWIPKHERVSIFERTIAIMESRKEELVTLAASEGGKPYVDSKVEVNRAINGIKIAIEEMGRFGGEEVPMGHTLSSVNRMAFTRREPIGVVAAVSAFNHPLNLIIHQTIPALAVGSPVIVKPARTTPLSCINFVNILIEAGLPEGWCQALVTKSSDSEKLVIDSRVNFFSFIGSGNVGWHLQSKLSPGTRSALEHGGVAPSIVDKDINLDEVIPSILKGAFYHSGQVCVSVQRIFVHEDIIDEFTSRLVEGADSLKVGDPLSQDTDCGPLIQPEEVDRVSKWVDEAVAEGAELLTGGNKLSETTYSPTVLLNPSPDSKVSRSEVFGPVVCVYNYRELQAAVEMSNSLPYAFQASIFTNNLDNAINASEQFNATAVMINDHTAFRVDWMPFGGRDVSGLGLGGIPHSMNDMSREKIVVFKSKFL